MSTSVGLARIRVVDGHCGLRGNGDARCCKKVSEKGESTGSARIARHGAREGARSGSQKEDGRSCARDRISCFCIAALCSGSLEPTLDMLSPVRTCEGNNPKPSRFPSSVERLRCVWCDNGAGSPSTPDLREALQAISVDVCTDWPATENAKDGGRSRASRGHPFSAQSNSTCSFGRRAVSRRPGTLQ